MLFRSVEHLLISEVQPGTEQGLEDEFVELYNPTNAPISIVGFSLKKQSSTGSESNLVSSLAMTGTVPAHGFFLIAHKNFLGSTPQDITYSANSNNLAYKNNGVLLYDASGTLIDRAWWVDIEKGASIERKAWENEFCLIATETNELLGNGCDTDSIEDFDVRLVPEPQNTLSFTEP